MRAAEDGHDIRPKRRGRPRAKEQPTGLVRRNVLVDPQSLERLRELYKATSDSEAIRRAVDSALLVREAQDLGEWLSARGGPVDVYGRTSGVSRLPVHLEPGDVPDDEKEWF